jgi:hypothetical protein
MLRADVLAAGYFLLNSCGASSCRPSKSETKGMFRQAAKKAGASPTFRCPHAPASTSVVNGTWLGDRMPSMYAVVEF